jgi:hypothetical protein
MPLKLPQASVVVRAVALVGLLIFGAAAIVLSINPRTFEGTARSYVSQRVMSELQMVLPETVRPDADALRRFTEEARQRLRDAAARFKEQFTPVLTELVARLCHFDCKTSRAVADFLLESIVSKHEGAVRNLQEIARGRYSEILLKLRNELLGFVLPNLALFALLFVSSFFMRGRFNVLVAPAIMLLTSMLIAIGFYVLGRDWFMVVLYDDYLRYGYLPLEIVIFLVFLDFYFRRGQTIGEILGALGAPLSICR